MNSRKRLLQTVAQCALALSFAAVLAGLSGGPLQIASAQEIQAQRQRGLATHFGMQSLSPGQTAQIAVVNPLEIIPCVRVRIAFDIYETDPPNPIRPGESDPARLHFVRAVSREVELEPGEAASFDYTAGARGAFVSPVTLVREINEVGDPHIPRVGEVNPTPIRTRMSAATSTLTINERGHVIFTPPGVRVGFDPQPDPPSPN
jgi:hypothetical protein